jgi:5-hydroxyisourate hydrolase-like protein (transthyretin family)
MQSRALLAAVLAVLTGHVVDRTTGQPLIGVDISAASGAKTVTARSDDGGRYTLKNLPAGSYTLTVSSDDVPPQHFSVVVHGAKAHFDITACSTTLDYSCAAAQP